MLQVVQLVQQVGMSQHHALQHSDQLNGGLWLFGLVEIQLGKGTHAHMHTQSGQYGPCRSVSQREREDDP